MNNNKKMNKLNDKNIMKRIRKEREGGGSKEGRQHFLRTRKYFLKLKNYILNIRKHFSWLNFLFDSIKNIFLEYFL